jgi:hypothetical protein
MFATFEISGTTGPRVMTLNFELGTLNVFENA